jgi:hypothetical protein
MLTRKRGTSMFLSDLLAGNLVVLHVVLSLHLRNPALS